ncbi:hypothetical protein [Bradyrhizobium sp. ERR14]|uniref:hypothetical protein n=1 Tax=Bradyrhizobium sp. ERR14 TaxID=2663837 RepID=UPI001608C0DC|nr:hypothetical protein [Bradyrhizobium sp. ERR14]MBB4399103.1 hypothetical protein [Bradyrhizobium sp. ERR14]
MAERKPYAATNENLIEHALAPAMRWLIAVALDGSTMTYGELKRMLEDNAGFSTIFATRIGFVAGMLMETIQEVEPGAPLINVLVVNQADRRPSEGAGVFMARRFGERRLRGEDTKSQYPQLWEENFKRAAGEVYSYTEAQWSALFERVFRVPLASPKIERDREKRHEGTEKDGIRIGRDYGSGGEGPFHKSLRMWVKDNPEAVHRTFTSASAETEVDLDSGDRVDVVYKLADRIVVLEVKSRISNEVDLIRGVFQCVKYRAVRQAMDVRDNAMVEAYLITETPLSGEISALVKRHGIRHFQAPRERS